MILTRFLFFSKLWKHRFLTLIVYFIICLFIYQSLLFYYKNFHRPIPLILLYTYNYSVKTRDSICRGVRNGGRVVNFDKCPRKCEFSCRLEDFKQRSPHAVLFFGEDFSWPFRLTNQNRSSAKQRWIFWSWEAPINHPEYTKSGLTFNWFEKNFNLFFSIL